MACLKNYTCSSCCNLDPCPIAARRRRKAAEDDIDAVENAAGVLWSHDLGAYSGGEFSHAVIQANSVVEDHSHVDTADGALFVGVYDGHGGDVASRFVSDDLFPRFNALAQQQKAINGSVLADTFAGTETEFLNLICQHAVGDQSLKMAGTCCLVGVIWRARLYVANAGDSRVVIGRKCRYSGGTFAEQLTKDDNANRASVRKELRAAHPNDERIVENTNGSWRVKGIIQVTKSIGDVYMKDQEFAFPPGHRMHINSPLLRPALSAVPTIYTRDLREHDQFLIFASDGLWDLLSNRRAVEIVLNNPRNGIARKLIREAMRVVCKKSRLVFERFQGVEAGTRRNFHDDISVVVVFLDSAVQPLLDQERPPAPEPLSVRGFKNGVFPGRFNVDGIN